MTKVHHGRLPTTTYGSVIHIYSSRRWSPILNSKVNLTSHLIKNTVRMVSIDFRTSCQETGYGNKQWVFLGSKGASLTVNRQDKIIINHPENKGAFFVPVILGSDKATVSVATGQTDYWPVYISIGNIHNNMQRAHRNGVILLGFLAIPKSKSSE